MITRRKFLKMSSAAGAGLLLPWHFVLGCGEEEQPGGTTGAQTVAFRTPAEIDKFIDLLPRLRVIEPDTGRYPGNDYYEIALGQFQQQLHSQLPPTTVWGYDGGTPGPTIEARSGRPVRVKWINDELPQTHLLSASIDTTIFGGQQYPEVRTVTHLHGGHTPPQSDGLPEAWSTPGASAAGPGYHAGDFVYPNRQQACTLWYHDHAMGLTRLNVYAGLAGMYIIRDDIDDGLGLPSGDYEVGLVIEDRLLNPDASLYYPTRGGSTVHPVWNMDFFGDVPLVNGKAFPFMEVEPRRYRLRMLNGSQSRFYNLWLEDGAGVLPFQVVGSDGGLLAKPAPVAKLLLAPAERADLIVDFSGLAEGTTLTLRNDAAAPFPLGGANVIPELMQFRVNLPVQGSDGSKPPAAIELPPIAPLTATPDVPTRNIVLVETEAPSTIPPWPPDPGGSPRMGVTDLLINGKFFSEPVDEQPRAGTTEIWQFFNATLETHPIHIHLVQFQILNRQQLDSVGYFIAWDAWRMGSGPKPAVDGYLTGAPEPPAPEEAGWKDTARARPQEILRLIARFDLPPDTPTPARYVYHCHILEHEDNEMMRPYEVI